MSAVIEVEMAARLGAPVFCPPLQRTVRGRIVVAELSEASGELMRDWPVAVPGKVIGLDEQGHVYIRDRLHEPAFAHLCDKLKAKELRPGPERENLGLVDRPTILFWLRRIVDAHLGEVIKGELPERIEGTPRVRFVGAEPAPDPALAAIDRLAAIMGSLLERLGPGKPTRGGV